MVNKIKTAMSAKCLIISANKVVTPYPVYPLGAACLVGALRNNGHVADHFDILADGGIEKLEELLKSQKYDLIGVSIRNLDSVDSAAPNHYLEDVVETVTAIRKASDTPIVLGGPAFSIMPEQLLELLEADYGVVGEGEELLPWLAGELVQGRAPFDKLHYAKPAGALWQPSDLTKTTADFYLRHGGMLNVQTKRGCPHKCSYCSYPNIEGKELRFRDPEEVATEVNRLRDHFGAQYIFFADSYFNDHEGRFLEVAEALIRNKNSLPWCAFFRPDNLAKSELALLKKAGLAAIEMGTDAAADETLAGINKSFTFDQVVELHNQIVDADIACAHYVMFGGPEEDASTLSAGLRNLDYLKGSVVFAFAGIRILPGTGIYQRAIDENIIDKDTPLLKPLFYFSPKISKEKIISGIKSSFAGKIDRIYPCHEFENRIETLHQMGFVGPLWDFILKKQTRRCKR